MDMGWVNLHFIKAKKKTKCKKGLFFHFAYLLLDLKGLLFMNVRNLKVKSKSDHLPV